MSESALSRTPLYSAHVALGARIVPFAGYEMPVQYSGVLDETKRCRESMGLFDVSHMGQFSVRGAGALAEVQKLVTNDLSKIALGQAQYNMLCNEQGGVIDDLIVYRRADDHTYICVNASNRHADYAWMKARLGSGVTLTDESDETALIALQGPKAEALLYEITQDPTVKSLKYYWAADAKILGEPCYLSRTGYTGEDGFELYVKNSAAEKVWNGLLEKGKSHGLVPVGLGARDTLRLEMGYPLHGHELSPEISPLQGGLGWVVKLQLPVPFTGQTALRRESEQGVARKLGAFVVEDRRIPRQGYPIVSKRYGEVGVITSGTFSPHRNAPIAMGLVKESAAGADDLHFQVRDALVPLTPSKLPFVPSKAKKS